MKVYDINLEKQLALVSDDNGTNFRYVHSLDAIDFPLEENNYRLLKQMHLIANNPRPTGLIAPTPNPMLTGWKYYDDNERTSRYTK